MTYPHNRTPSEKEDLFFGKKVAKALRGETKQRNPNSHEEADLHLAFCKWVRKEYPNDQFIRHEREGKRSPFMQNLFGIYNSDLDKMPDFELLEPVYDYDIEGYMIGIYHRLYIEFKRPGTILTLRDGITIKSEYLMQYKRHIRFWEQNSVAYFCSDLEVAMELVKAYKDGRPLPMQVFSLPGSNSPDTFFDDYRTHLDGIG